jgi:hypothetical protein
VHADGPEYERGLAVLRARGSSLTRDRVRAIVVIEVTDASALVSPAYDTGASEDAVVARWLAHHTDLHRSH